jgi:hypothetical protein
MDFSAAVVPTLMQHTASWLGGLPPDWPHVQTGPATAVDHTALTVAMVLMMLLLLAVLGLSIYALQVSARREAYQSPEQKLIDEVNQDPDRWLDGDNPSAPWERPTDWWR